MSSQQFSDDPTAESLDDPDAGTVEELAGRLEVLREENRRLRSAHVRARQAEYRRAALGIGSLGVVAGLAGLAFPTARETLFALAGVGLFTAVLIYYLVPERFVAASVGERTYAAHSALGDELVAELGLQDDRVYVPTSAAGDGRSDSSGDGASGGRSGDGASGGRSGDGASGGRSGDGTATVRLFVPQREGYALPDEEALGSLFVVTDDERTRGASLPATGAPLLGEFERTATGEVGGSPADLADQLTEGVVEAFELADDAVPDVDPAAGRLTVGVRGSAFGAVDRFDHPVVSFVASGLATGLKTPVRVESVVAGDDRFDYLVSYGWDGEGEEDKSVSGDAKN